MDLVLDDEFDQELNDQIAYHEGSYRMLALIDSKINTPVTSDTATPKAELPESSSSSSNSITDKHSRLPKLV